jgi:hypothetical protein
VAFQWQNKCHYYLTSYLASVALHTGCIYAAFILPFICNCTFTLRLKDYYYYLFLTANGFTPGGSSTTIGQNRQVTHITQSNNPFKQDTNNRVGLHRIIEYILWEYACLFIHFHRQFTTSLLIESTWRFKVSYVEDIETQRSRFFNLLLHRSLENRKLWT